MNNIHCVPCRGGVGKLSPDAIALAMESAPLWTLSNDKSAISRRFTLKNFATALAFVNEVGQVAEAEKHHPDITFGWGYAQFTLTTHDVSGLHANDFIIAKRIDTLAVAAGLA